MQAVLQVKYCSVIISIILGILLFYMGQFLGFLNNYSDGKKVSEEPFVVFVSASDEFGTYNPKENYRSDTNILAVVNPKTSTVLMISTPRDYYVPIIAKSVAPDSYDKLTHAGNTEQVLPTIRMVLNLLQVVGTGLRK